MKKTITSSIVSGVISGVMVYLICNKLKKMEMMKNEQ